MTNYYKILGVEDFASSLEIKTAYRKLSKKFHPDVNQGDKFFEDRFKEIQIAYEFLNNPIKRKHLDDFLRNIGSNKTHRSQKTRFTESNDSEEVKSDEGDNQSNKKAQQDNAEKQKQASTSNKGASTFILPIIGYLILFVIYQISTTEKKHENSYRNQDSHSNLNYIPPMEQVKNHLPSSSDYEGDFNLGDINNSTNSSYGFSIGSSKQEVLSIQGNPTMIIASEALNTEIWGYGSSRVAFENGKVSEYSDLGNNLRIQDFGNSTNKISQSGSYSIGSPKSEVLGIQGNPSKVIKLAAIKTEIWYYGLSSLTFENGKLSEYNNFGNNLKVQYK